MIKNGFACRRGIPCACWPSEIIGRDVVAAMISLRLACLMFCDQKGWNVRLVAEIACAIP